MRLPVKGLQHAVRQYRLYRFFDILSKTKHRVRDFFFRIGYDLFGGKNKKTTIGMRDVNNIVVQNKRIRNRNVIIKYLKLFLQRKT